MENKRCPYCGRTPVVDGDRFRCPNCGKSRPADETLNPPLKFEPDSGSPGYWYWTGHAALGKKKYKEAFKWLYPAALWGHASAQCELGRMYEEGLGVPQDLTEAIAWYGQAYVQGEKQGKEGMDRIKAKLAAR